MARKPTKIANPDDNVPGVSDNPATNLLMADIAMRAGSTLLRNVVERSFLKGRYGKDTAREIVHNRSLKHTLASVAVAKLATRSVPGAAIIGGGLVVKTLFDRSQKRRKAQKNIKAERAGDRKLLEQAKDD